MRGLALWYACFARTGYSSTVGGGRTNIASGKDSVIFGGSHNEAAGVKAIVVGGSRNSAMGDGAIIGGGSENIVTVCHVGSMCLTLALLTTGILTNHSWCCCQQTIWPYEESRYVCLGHQI